MSSDVATIDLQTGSTVTDLSSSGVWNESYVRQPKTTWRIGRLAQIADIVLAVAASPATAILDYWFLEGRRRDAVTASWVLEGIIGRPISRAEALRIAHRIIERAERERLELSEWEAQHGIQWEEEL